MIRHGDCREVMATLDADSVDAVVCDPPYGLSFMGREWDHGVPGVPFWTEALRVAKPGAYLVAFGGTRTYHRLTCAIEDAGWEIRDCLMWLHGQGFPKGKAQLKPAWEPIIMARKKGPLAQLNIDGCRIACEPGDIGNRIDDPNRPSRRPVNHMNDDGSFAKARNYIEPLGRWPANVALDEEAARLLDEQSGERPVSGSARNGGRSDAVPSGIFGARPQGTLHHDSGGASRFFYTAKASRSERGEGNHHPTVKPVDLMCWLVRLVTPPNGLVLDPFCGSGSTGVAAIKEGFRFVGIEREAEYVEIARGRIGAAPLNLFSEPAA